MSRTRTDPARRPALDLEDLYDHAPCGYLTTLPDGLIVDVNETLLSWTGHRREDLVGTRRFADLLPRGARAFHVTHHLPALEQAGEMREVASEILRADGERMAVMLSSTLRHDDEGRTDLIRMTVTDATARRGYERDLRAAHDSERAAREQAERLAEALARRSREQTAIAELGRLALDNADPETLLTRAAEAITVTLEAGAARVVDQDTGEQDEPSADTVRVTVEDSAGRHALLVGGLSRELDRQDRGFLETIANVVGVAIERRRLDERHRHLALHDPLTGLPNRMLLFDRLGRALARARRRGAFVGVLLLDLDNFKDINDALGHHAGDETLRVLAHRFASVLRSADTVARLGGDEFAVVCEGVTAETDVEHVRERLSAALIAPIPLQGGDRLVEASIGMVVSDGSEQPEELLQQADRAMYRVKQQHAATRD